MKIGTSDYSVSNQRVNYTSEKGSTKFSDIFKAATNELQAQSSSAAKLAWAGVAGPKTGSDAVITDMALYESLKCDNKNVNINYHIAKELIENNAVNVENIDPKNCTELEFNILEMSFMKSKGYEKVTDEWRGWHFELMGMRLISQARGEYASFSTLKHNWAEKWEEHLKKQIAIGNTAFDRYEKVNQYMKELVSYADGLKTKS